MPRSSLGAALVLVLAGLQAGCFHHGTRGDDIRPDPSRGATVRLRLVDVEGEGGQGGRIEQGELIVVRDTLVVLAQPDRYLVAAESEIVESWIGPRYRDGRIGRGVAGLPPEEEIRRHARHPFGLTNAQLADVMRADGVSALAVSPRRGRPATLPLDSLPETALRIGAGYQQVARPAAADAFLDSLRAAGSRFTRVEDAIAEGYRKLGPSFPGMGEHWIHPGRIVSGRVDPSSPSVLAYATIDGEKRLIAAAFTVPLAPGEAPPAYPAGRGIWHDHSGSVDEEVLLLAHPASHMAADDRPRLAMFHAWLWLDNPDGVFAQNNWMLPFAQARVPLAVAPTPHGARALSLLTAGSDYYMALFAAAAAPDEGERAALRNVLDRYADAVQDWREGQRGVAAGKAALIDLERIWVALWRDIRRELRDATWERIAAVADESVRAATPRPIRVRDVRVFGSLGAPLYYADDAPAAMGVGASLTVGPRVALRGQFERLEADRLGRLCYDACYAAGPGVLQFWNAGVDYELARFAGDRFRVAMTLGLGAVRARIEGDHFEGGRRERAMAWLAAIRGETRPMSFASVFVEGATYVATLDMADGSGSLYPSVRLGLAFGAGSP